MFEPSEFFHFLQKPQYQSLERKKTNIFGTALKIYLLTLLFIGLFDLLSTTVIRAFLSLPIDKTLEVPLSLKEHLWIYFILVVIIAPIAEEVIFRLSLIFDPINFALSFSTLIALIINKVFNGFIGLIAFCLFFFLINRLAIIFRLPLNSFWKNYFKYIFYCLPIIFGVVHISNYEFVDRTEYFIAPILILPQLAIGFIMSFTRLYYLKGFLICIIIHVLMNMISISVFLLHYSHP